jgi:hypothetical protein
MNRMIGKLALVIGCALSPQLHAAPTAQQARDILQKELVSDLWCKDNASKYDRASDEESKVLLQASGATITPGNNSNLSYQFTTPLMVNGLPIFAVQQTVSQRGTIFTAETVGDPKTFAKELHAQKVAHKTKQQLLGLGNELFHKQLKDSSNMQMIVGADSKQKTAGHFYFGCSKSQGL